MPKKHGCPRCPNKSMPGDMGKQGGGPMIRFSTPHRLGQHMAEVHGDEGAPKRLCSHCAGRKV